MHLPVPSDSSRGRVGGRGRARRLLLCAMPMAVTGLALRGLVAGASALRSSALSRRGPPHNGSGTQLPQSAHCAHEDTEGGVEWGARWLAAVSADERRHLDAPAVTGPASSHAPRTRTRAAAGAVSGPCGQDTSSGKALAMLPWGVGRSEALVIYGQVSRADTVRCRGTEWWHAANQRAVMIAN